MTTPNDPHPSRPTGLSRRTLRRHWLPILAAWSVSSALVIVGASALLSTPLYRASSLIRVDPRPQGLVDEVAPAGGETPEAILQTQVQLLTSPNVLTAASTSPAASKLPRIKAAGDVVADLRQSVKVAALPGTYLIEVSMTDPNPVDCAVIVNAVVDGYMEISTEWVDGMNRMQVDKLSLYLRDLRNQTDELERRWKELVAKEDIDAQVLDQAPVGGRAKVTIEEFRQARKEIFAIQLELTQAEAWLDTVKKLQEKPGEANDPARIEKQVERRFQADPEVIELAAKLLEAKKNLDRIVQVNRMPNDPAERAATKALDGLKAQYNKLWEDRSKAFRAAIELTSATAPDDQELRDASTRVKMLQVKREALKKLADSFEVRNHRQATDEVEIALILDQRKSLKAMEDAVNRRLEQLKFVNGGETRVRPVNRAITAARPVAFVGPRPALLALIPLLLLIPAFALFAGVEAVRSRGPKPRPAADV